MNYTAFLLRAGSLLVLLALLLLGGRYLLPAVLPFLVGGVLALLLRPLACWIRRCTHMHYTASAVAAALLFYGLFLLLLCNLGFLLFAQTVSFFTRLPALFVNDVIPAVNDLWTQCSAFLERFLPSAGSYLAQLSLWMGAVTSEALSQLSSGVLHGAASFVKSLPATVFGLFLGILSSIFILCDYDGISAFIQRQLNPRMQWLLLSSKDFLMSTGKNVIKAYLLLMTLTFTEAAVGLWLLGVEYFAVMGLVVAAVDVLPVLGSGAVLIPWGVYQLLWGSPRMGIGILLLYGVITAVRAIAEPKILGDRIGLPPLVTILSMYLGLRLFGVLGLLLTPMAVTLLVYLNDRGHLHLWKKG